MPTVYTIEGARRRRRKRSGLGSASSCKRVKMGKKRGCTIELCKTSKGRWKFQKGTSKCK